MDLLREIFRTQPDGQTFVKFGVAHISILLISILVCILIINFKKDLKENKKLGTRVKNTIAITLIMQQVILYIWYVVSGYRVLEEGLPLYNCRVSIICLAIGLLINNKKLKTLAVYWGGFGAVFALLLPGTDPFAFPHYTKISYFIGHMFLIWGVIYVLSVDELKLSEKNLEGILIFTNIYHIIVFFVDNVIGANYCYLIKSPITLAIMPQFLYTFIAMMVFNVAIILSYIVIKKLSNIEIIEENIEDENSITLITMK
ncbi:TIGR02206 family membrane protein [Clostridium chauvoei]|uniref:TMEM164-related integral membrane acyltransferase n=1 Tax=Clostridium chauvoei TaxID=46867 RepID=UPI001C855F48|nr:TIGR02206 family membrane protein [Clostridium chauvoei]MBX7392721.1 TIGR02206 family membrane protein [Clostridium chauvoei]